MVSLEHLQMLELRPAHRCEVSGARRGLSAPGRLFSLPHTCSDFANGPRKGRDRQLSQLPYSFLPVNLKKLFSSPLHLLVVGKHLG